MIYFLPEPSWESISLMPDVPTSAQAGYGTVLSDNWYGLSAPAGVPADILDKLQKAAVKTIASAEFKRVGSVRELSLTDELLGR